MRYRRAEIFAAIALTLVCYYGDYYLKESSVKVLSEHTLTWQVCNIAWLLSTIIIGYLGLRGHEIKWVKNMWLTINCLLLAVLFINKMIQYLWHHSILPDSTSTVIRTPFFFIIAAFLPRWFIRDDRPKEN